MKGDRQNFDFVKSSLSAEGFDVVYDINGAYCQSYFLSSSASHALALNINLFIYISGREANEVEPIIDALPKLEQ